MNFGSWTPPLQLAHASVLSIGPQSVGQRPIRHPTRGPDEASASPLLLECRLPSYFVPLLKKMPLKGFSSSAPRVSLAEVEEAVAKLPPSALEQLRDDLYGSLTVVEDDATIGLSRLNEELDAISERGWYDRALVECPDYVGSEDFLLPFLRATRYDAKAAAQRLVHYWNQKVELWGEERAFRPITVHDFVGQDRDALEKGGLRVLPSRDSAGRAIVVIDRTRFDQSVAGRTSMLRLIWYMHHVAIQDPEVQRNGIVYIAGNHRRRTSLFEQDRKLDSRGLALVREALPVRVVGIHHFTCSRLIEYVVPLLLALLSKEMRDRYRPHCIETDEEFLEALAPYGITPAAIPMDLGGSLPFEYAQWLVNDAP